jgi:hypothetical protein
MSETTNATVYLTDKNLLYELVKDYIQNGGELKNCYTIKEYSDDVTVVLQFVLDMLIKNVKEVKEARLHAMRDANWNNWNASSHK